MDSAGYYVYAKNVVDERRCGLVGALIVARTGAFRHPGTLFVVEWVTGRDPAVQWARYKVVDGRLVVAWVR